jgi:hypothetical protein
MFRPEGRWGQYKRSLANARYPEANMVLTAADKEMVIMNCVLGASSAEEEGNAWGEHSSLKDPAVAVQLMPLAGEEVVLKGSLFAAVHLFYLGEDPVYAEAWAEYVRDVMPAFANERGWNRQQCERRHGHGSEAWDFSPAALEIVHGYWHVWAERHRSGDRMQQAAAGKLLNRSMRVHKYMMFNGMRFSKGDWIMARPNAANHDLGELREPAPGLPAYGVPRRMWFGKLTVFYSHMPDVRVEGSVNQIVDVEWHPTVGIPHGPYDVDLQAPVVYAAMDKDHPPLFSCLSILPLQMTALPHPNRHRQLVMLQSSWHALSAVDCPVPWPRLQRYRGG